MRVRVCVCERVVGDGGVGIVERLVILGKVNDVYATHHLSQVSRALMLCKISIRLLPLTRVARASTIDKYKS